MFTTLQDLIQTLIRLENKTTYWLELYGEWKSWMEREVFPVPRATIEDLRKLRLIIDMDVAYSRMLFSFLRDDECYVSTFDQQVTDGFVRDIHRYEKFIFITSFIKF